MKEFGKFLAILGFVINLYTIFLILTLGYNNYEGLIAPSFTILIGVTLMYWANLKESRKRVGLKIDGSSKESDTTSSS